MRRNFFILALSAASVLAILKFSERFFLLGHLPLQIYLVIVGSIFLAVGIWAGQKLSRTMKSGDIISPMIHADAFPEAGLTKRETEILMLISQGLSNREIADHLFVSGNTVKKHLNNIYSKLNVRRRTQALIRARELGIFQV